MATQVVPATFQIMRCEQCSSNDNVQYCHHCGLLCRDCQQSDCASLEGTHQWLGITTDPLLKDGSR